MIGLFLDNQILLISSILEVILSSCNICQGDQWHIPSKKLQNSYIAIIIKSSEKIYIEIVNHTEFGGAAG